MDEQMLHHADDLISDHFLLFSVSLTPQTINRNRRPTCYVSICATAAAVASSDSEIPLPISSLS